MNRSVRPAFGMLLALGVVGPPSPASGAGARPPEEPPRNLLVLTIDTLRRDRLGCYGWAAGRTPNIDRLARSGTLFELTVSSAPFTAPSHATMFTGLSPRVHGLIANGQTLPEDRTTLAEMLQERGYRTAAVVSSPVLGSTTGLQRGFDTYHDDFDLDEKRNWLVSSAEKTNGIAIAWIQANREGPFFLWIHYYDPHQPYDAPGLFGRYADPGYDGEMPQWDSKLVREWNRLGAQPAGEGEHLRARYDAEIHYVDTQVGVLLAALDEAGIRRSTLVCLTSDHGETLGEHASFFGHANQLYDTTLLVPLILSYPASVPAANIYAPPARLIDLAPTLLELLGLPVSGQMEGRSVAGALTRERPPPAFTISETHPPSNRTAPDKAKISIRVADGKLIRSLETDSTEVFDLLRDPSEQQDLAGTGTRLEDDLNDALDMWLKNAGDAPEMVPIDETTRERLKALGYVD